MNGDKIAHFLVNVKQKKSRNAPAFNESESCYFFGTAMPAAGV